MIRAIQDGAAFTALHISRFIACNYHTFLSRVIPRRREDEISSQNSSSVNSSINSVSEEREINIKLLELDKDYRSYFFWCVNGFSPILESDLRCSLILIWQMQEKCYQRFVMLKR